MIIEVERNLIADFPHLDPVSVRQRVGQMRRAVEDNVVDSDSFADVPDAINPKDRHVIAPALAGEASVVVTNDRRLRAETKAGNIDPVAMSADDFAVPLWDLMPDDIDVVIRTLVAKRTKRRVTAEELIAALRDPFPTMAAAWLATHD